MTLRALYAAVRPYLVFLWMLLILLWVYLEPGPMKKALEWALFVILIVVCVALAARALVWVWRRARS
jgi:hypothetical protein